jgi:nitrate reductase NapE component
MEAQILKRLFCLVSLVFLFFLTSAGLSLAKDLTFKVTNEMIYQKLIEMEKRQAVFAERFKQIDKRFEQIDKRFEDVNKCFEELRADMNKRFEQVDKRFEEMMSFLKIIVGIFTTLTAAVIGFAYWDRRTIIRKARDETIAYLEREGNLRKLIDVLKELAKEDRKVAEILHMFGLL